MASADNKLLREALRALRNSLPPGWLLGESRPPSGRAATDATVKLTAPDRSSGWLAVEAKRNLDPRSVSALEALRGIAPKMPLLAVSRFLTRSTRERLRESNINYLDLTGNMRVVMPKPGILIEREGADANPERETQPVRSLRGPKSGRIVRRLIDSARPIGVRALAAATKTDPGYVSRVLAFLESEDLIQRSPSTDVIRFRKQPMVSLDRTAEKKLKAGRRGSITKVNWAALVRRWAEDAPLDSRGAIGTYLEPRGFSALLSHLADFKERYAVTGALAASQFAPVAAPRLATIWVRDAAAVSPQLGLRPAESGANVLLVEPFDDDVFRGVSQRRRIIYAAPSQVAADLLTSPGRGPAEGEELLSWMQANEADWRG